MSSYNTNLIKICLIDAFILWQVIKISRIGIGSFEYIVFESTISKYSLFIFYGFISITLDNLFLRKTWNNFSIIRYISKIKWTGSLFKSIISQQAITTLISFGAIFFYSLIFRISIEIKPNILICFAVLFTYLLLLNFIMVLIMSVSQRPEVALGVSIVVNIFFLVVGRNLMDMNKQKYFIEFILFTAVVSIALLSACIMYNFDIYKDKNTLYVFEK